MRPGPGVAVLAVCLAAALVSAQEPGPPVTFRAEVNFVEVDAFVTDAQGAVVRNLTAGDFEVLEDGRAQKVTAFSFIDIPIERAERPLFAAAPIELDVQTNAHVEGRVYLLVLDDNHTDPARTPRVKAIAREFVERRVGINDLVAVAYTSGRADASQEFTNNRAALLRAIDRFVGRKFPPSTVTQLSNITPDENGRLVPGPDIWKEQRFIRARQSMSLIRRLGELMAGVQGRRKAMILVGEGIDYDIDAITDREGSEATDIRRDARDAIAGATRGNVAIYAVDPRGLEGAGAPLIGTATVLNEQSLGLTSVMEEQQRAASSLRALAGGTGGFAAVNRNDLTSAFDQIVAENSSYYLLGYYPAIDRRSGRFRKLDVRVKRPGLQVRARNGYYEATGRATAPNGPARGNLSPAVGEAISSPVPIVGLPMKVFAAPFKGTAPNAAVALTIEVDLSRLALTPQNGTFNEKLEVAFSAYDAKGTFIPGNRHEVTLTMKPDTYERVKANGFRVLSQIALPPGRYQLRVAGGTAKGPAGSVLYDLDVPDFASGPLTMSGVALTAPTALQVGTIKPTDPLAGYLPAPATAAREFAAGDVLALFAEFYENLANAPAHQLDFRAELRAPDGRVVREVSEQRASTELKGSAGGYGFMPRLSLNGIEPGLYVIHVEGRSRAAGDVPPVSRDIQIRVR